MNREEMLRVLYGAYEKHYFALNDPKATEKISLMYDTIYTPHLPDTKNLPALDCGSGGGAFLLFLKRHGYSKAYGLDMSPRLVEYQKDYLKLNVVQGDVIAHLRDAKDDFFGLICGNDFLEHQIKEDAVDFLLLAYKKLCPGGRLFIKVPNCNNPFFGRNRYNDFTHEIGFTENSLRFVHEACGFEEVLIISDHPYNKEPEYFSELRKLYPPFGDVPAPVVLSKSLVAISSKLPQQ